MKRSKWQRGEEEREGWREGGTERQRQRQTEREREKKKDRERILALHNISIAHNKS